MTPTHFENKHLSAEDSDRIKVALADVGAILIRPVGGAGSVWTTWWGSWWVLGRVGTTGGDSGKSLSWGTVRRSCRKTMRTNLMENLILKQKVV